MVCFYYVLLSGCRIVGRIGTSCRESCLVGLLRYCWRYYLVRGICI